jgi:hypothetical protein
MSDISDLYLESESQSTDWVSRKRVSYFFAVSPGGSRENNGRFLPHPFKFTIYTYTKNYMIYMIQYIQQKVLIAYFPLYTTGRIENESNNSFIVACVFVTAVTCLTSHCLATIGGYTYRHTDWREGFIKYAVEMGSGAAICMPSFIKIGSAVQKLIGGYIHSQTRRQHGDLISLLSFFQNKESNAKNNTEAPVK